MGNREKDQPLKKGKAPPGNADGKVDKPDPGSEGKHRKPKQD
ncbi:hypothetical protein [Kitasatospora sp. NPDC005751]